MEDKNQENLTRLPAPSAQADSGQATRPPVVVFLGHVDHGKSSLLESIKDLKITAKESGGITQHIGAYEIEHQGRKITFIDTPGHEAFSAMRARGAKVADIAVLVVAADEGVKPQTKEAISHIKKAGIPMVVAINKMDKTGADAKRAQRELSAEDVLVEDMGGKVPSIEVSAKTNKGIPGLLEMICLVAEIENLKADLGKPAEGAVIEAYLDAFRGPTATLVLSDGILKTGDIIGTSFAFGKVKNLENFKGESVEKALPSMPAIVLGFEKVPKVGEKFKTFSSLKEAQEFIKESITVVPQEEFVLKAEEDKLEEDKRVLNIILKVDVLGSLEAITDILKDIPKEQVRLKILKAEVGTVNENDVKMARESNARIFAFRVKADQIARKLAERENIKVRSFDIIYELSQAVRETMEKIVKPQLVRTDLGQLRVLVVFKTEKRRQIVGGRLVDGEVKKGVLIEIFRNEEKIGQGKLVNLQKNKKDIERAKKGEECGILYEGEARIEKGDKLVFYIEERIKGGL